MPLPAPSASPPSLVIKSNNEAAVERAVVGWARGIGDRHPEVRRIIWFGSRVNGIPAPGSDVDVCLVLAHSEKPFRERVGDYLPVGFPVGLDLFPYTQAELERLRREHPSWHRAMTSGSASRSAPARSDRGGSGAWVCRPKRRLLYNSPVMAPGNSNERAPARRENAWR